MDDTSPEQAGSGSFTAAVKKQAKDRYVHAPQDASTQRPLCSICQEKLSWQWHPEANDFVFMDALQLGEKYYHATCFEDFSKATGTAMPTTPEPVLGKRKAEADAPLSGKKVRAY
jgi:pre-mRNA cleavage complex 2 protein Pcf11